MADDDKANTGTAAFESGQGNTLTVEFPTIEEPYVCQYCDDEFTLDQIKKVMTAKATTSRVANINKILPYLNKYRKDFQLDTCLKKAHFIAQVCHESAQFRTFEESENWYYWSTKKNKAKSFPGVFSNNKLKLDETMKKSLKGHFTDIFTIKDKDDKVLTKTEDEIIKIIEDNDVKVIDKAMYANFDKGEELITEIKEKKEGSEEEVVKYKIYYKDHKAFGIPLLSRMYAPYTGDKRGLGNGDELTRDGWIYKGRGLKQLTGVGNYENFTKYRNRTDITFPDDDTGEIDFAEKVAEGEDIKTGNYVKIAEPMYAVQSALYFWTEGTKYSSKYAYENAEDDDITKVSRAVNRYDSGAESTREGFYNKARKKGSFDITRHHKDYYDNGSDEQKKAAKAYFKKWKDSDDEAKKHHEAIEKEESEATEGAATGTDG